MDEIEAYVNQFECEKREWIDEFTSYMREKHPQVKAKIWFRMPTYQVNNDYIAFSIAKDHFTFHTNDHECMQMVKDVLDRAKYGKRSVQIHFNDQDAKRVIYNTIELFARKQHLQSVKA